VRSVPFKPLGDRQAFCRHDRYQLAQDTACQELQLFVRCWGIAQTDDIREKLAVATIDYPDRRTIS
jgi:hypothetical protein